MRGTHRTHRLGFGLSGRAAIGLAGLLALGLGVGACTRSSPETASVDERALRSKSPAVIRASRRLFDGAPPVIPHVGFGISCTECHNDRGIEVPGTGFAPPSPHLATTGMSATSRCRQCHVERTTDALFVASTFQGLRQDLRSGKRQHELAPPVIPHPVFMRENCVACHDGPAAREEIRTPHPERERCQQCHVERTVTSSFPGNSSER